MIKQLILILISITLSAPSVFAQNVSRRGNDEDERAQIRLTWLNDLRILETESSKLEQSLARALSKTEIAAAAWDLDKTWSKELLRKAYELTFPVEEDQVKLREKPAGSPPVPFTSAERARSLVSRRVLQVASRDHEFSVELAKLARTRLGPYEAHLNYTTLASQAFNDGDKDNAGKYLLQAIDADPTQITAALTINDIAAKDRTLADDLILEYMQRLRTIPLSNTNQNLSRVFFILTNFVYPRSSPERQIAPPGPAVMRGYVSFVLDTLTNLQDDPAYLKAANPMLMSIWPLVRQYAPDLTNTFLALEQRTSGSGDNAFQKTDSVQEMNKAFRTREDQRIDKALDSDKPDQALINLAINRGDFAKARKLIDKLPDGIQKNQFNELTNTREAISLAASGDIVAARALAERLNNATSILQVYPAIINKCLASKDEVCASDAVSQAVRQIKSADTKLPSRPSGQPAVPIGSDREIDPVLLSLGRFAKAIAPKSETVAWSLLDDLVLSANQRSFDTSQGRTGFEPDIFKLLASKSEPRVYLAANNLKDRLQRVVALANIYQGLVEAQAKLAPRR